MSRTLRPGKGIFPQGAGECGAELRCCIDGGRCFVCSLCLQALCVVYIRSKGRSVAVRLFRL